MIIGIDFDGTCVNFEYPLIGRDIGAQRVLKRLVDFGHRLILWTMRSGKPLDEAVGWFEKNEIPLWGINTNPTQHEWTTSPKAHCDLIIDDVNLGCPLTQALPGDRPFVCWDEVEKMLEDRRVLTPNIG